MNRLATAPPSTSSDTTGRTVGTILALIFVLALMGVLAWWAFFSVRAPAVASRPTGEKTVEGAR